MQFSFVGICLDRKEKRRGSEKAPDAIRESFETAETFIDGIDLQDHWIKDSGNITTKDYDSIERQVSERVEELSE
jgi:arginase family enzyme